MVNLAEHIVEIVNTMNGLVFENLVELFSFSVGRLPIRGYRYSTGINRTGPNL